MSSAMTDSYGGWATERPAVTGASSSLSRLVLVGCAAAGIALSSVGTGGMLYPAQLQRRIEQVQHAKAAADVSEVAPVRTPSDDLARIREVLNPAVSDLATTFGVSRQSVYNWLKGEPVAEENASKLQDLAQAADVLAHEGVTVNTALLKSKFANGRTLLQVAQAGESAREAAVQLVQIHRREMAQRERMAARFANRAKTPPSADFDLPTPNDYA